MSRDVQKIHQAGLLERGSDEASLCLWLEQDCTRLDAGEGVHSFELKEVGVSHSSRVLPTVFLASKSYKVTTIHFSICMSRKI